MLCWIPECSIPRCQKGWCIDISMFAEKEIEESRASSSNGMFSTLRALLSSSKRGATGAALLCVICAIAVLAPFVAPYDPYALGSSLLQPPSRDHLCGTDHLGRDVFSMLVYGTRVSLVVGVMAALISGLVGTLAGGIAGFFVGGTDRAISAIIDVFLMIPTFFLIIIIVAMFGSSLVNVMVIIGLTSWPSNARLMRAEALSIRERGFIIGARAIGESNWSILFRHVIPNGILPIVANTTMQVAGAILTEASLSFLGLGDPNVVSWGQLIQVGSTYFTSGWWVSTFGGLAVILTVMSFYLLGDGINELLNSLESGERR